MTTQDTSLVEQAVADEIPRASEAEALASLREFALGPIKAVFTWSEAATVLELVETLTKSGIIEVAVRNPSVAEYMAHWEGRTEKAEAALSEAADHIHELEEALADLCDAWEINGGKFDGNITQSVAAARQALTRSKQP